MFNLILVFCAMFCFSANALYVKQSEALSLNITKTFLSKTNCGLDCINIPSGYKTEYFRVLDVLEDDLANPNFELKSNVTLCTDQTDCETKLLTLDCGISDSSFPYQKLIKNDFTEIYCTRVVSYPQVSSGQKHVVIDQSLKDAYESTKAIKKAEDDAIQAKIADMDLGKKLYAIVQIKNKMKGLSKGQRRTLRTNLSTIKEDLMDGNLCDARVDIAALTADGTLILSSDITEILAKIDAYKTCP